MSDARKEIVERIVEREVIRWVQLLSSIHRQNCSFCPFFWLLSQSLSFLSFIPSSFLSLFLSLILYLFIYLYIYLIVYFLPFSASQGDSCGNFRRGNERNKPESEWRKANFDETSSGNDLFLPFYYSY